MRRRRGSRTHGPRSVEARETPIRGRSDDVGRARLTRVLCLTSWYPPHHYGGYEIVCLDAMTRLAARGHHVEVLCSGEKLPAVRDPEPPDRHVHRRLALYYRDGDIWSPPLRGRLAMERENHRALAAALDSCQPDVVSIWHVGAMSLGLVTDLVERGLPLVYFVHDLWPAYAVKLDAWLRLFARWPPVGRLVARVTGVPATLPDLDASGAFCFVSQHTRRQAREGSPWRFPCSAVVYAGIELALFDPGSDPRPPGWAGRLLYVGRLDPRKGIETVLRAMPMLPEATLAIVGRGSPAEVARLQMLATDLGVGDRTTFSQAEREELPAVYRSADVCVFPSEWQEPFGLVPLEAMGCGTPVVATGVGGSAEFLADGENCLLVEQGNPRAIADAVNRLAANADLRARLMASGLETARFFDVEHFADAVEAWHDAAVAGFPEGPLPNRRPPLRATGSFG